MTANETALTTIEPINRLPERIASPTPSDLLRIAVDRGTDVAQLERLMALQERWEASEAKKKFSEAFAAFKAEAVHVIRTKLVTDGPLKGKRHAELSGIVNAATPALSRYGLSTAWRISRDEKDWIEVTCTLSHSAGHSESVSMGAAPDSGPGRNAIQARGSAKTYLERYTLTAILGLAPEDDDDGSGTQTRGEAYLAARPAAKRASGGATHMPADPPAPAPTPPPPPTFALDDAIARLLECETMTDAQAVFRDAWKKLADDEPARAKLKSVYDDVKSVLTPTP